MREIKFRAWDKVNKTMVHIDGEDLYLADGKVFEVREESRYYQAYMEKRDVSDRYIPVQHTGLKDRFGEEIFEGDILANEHTERYVIQWFPSDVRFIAIHDEEYARGVRDDGGEAFGLVWVDCTVIGNIYEHAHLLEPNNMDIELSE